MNVNRRTDLVLISLVGLTFVIGITLMVIIELYWKQPNKKKLAIYTDPKYGCEYVATTNGAGLYPRLDGEQHVGCKLNALIPVDD